MKYWVNILHIYQPPTQQHDMLVTVAKESYDLIVGFFSTYPSLKLTLNISGSLVELLELYGKENLLQTIKKYASEGRIELTGSAMYHPILPLLPEEEVVRQIELNDMILTRVFGAAYSHKGFYLPEMAFSPRLGKIIQQQGFEWIVLDEMHFPGPGKPDPSKHYIIQETGLTVLFRDRKLSKSFPPEAIIRTKDTLGEYTITAHDGEMYGHWHKNDHGFYKQAFSSSEITTLTASEYIQKLSTIENIVPSEGSWETTAEHLSQGINYHLWSNPHNAIHDQLWLLARSAVNIVNGSKHDPNFESARRHLDRGLASCMWWWAADEKPDVFSPVTWNPDEIEKGALELIKSVRSLASGASAKKVECEKVYSKLIELIWTAHWSKRP